MTLMYLIKLYESADSVHYENPCVVLCHVPTFIQLLYKALLDHH